MSFRTTAVLAIRIISDATKGTQGLEKTATAAARLERGLKKAALPAAAALAGIRKLGGPAIEAAKKLELASAALKHFFRDYQNQLERVKAVSHLASTEMGMTAAAYQKAALQMSMALSNAGVPMYKLADKSEKLLRRAADMGIVLGGDTPRAIYALQAALNGSFQPLDAFGARIRREDVNARMAAKGLDQLEGEQRRVAETMVTLDLVMEQTAVHYGMYAAEVHTARVQSDQMRIAIEEARAEIGTHFLPMLVRWYQLQQRVAVVVGENSGVVAGAAKVVAILSGAVLALNAGLKVYKSTVEAVNLVKRAFAKLTGKQTAAQKANTVAQKANTVVVGKATVAGNVKAASLTKATAAQVGQTVATKKATLAQKALNLVLKKNPVGLVIVAVAALAAGIRHAWENSERFRKVVKKVFAAILRPINAVRDAIDRIRFPEPPAWFASLTGSAARQQTATAELHRRLSAQQPTYGLVRSFGPPISQPAPNVNLTVNGALDPYSVAAQIEDVLGKYFRATGQRTFGQAVF